MVLDLSTIFFQYYFQIYFYQDKANETANILFCLSFKKN